MSRQPLGFQWIFVRFFQVNDWVWSPDANFGSAAETIWGSMDPSQQILSKATTHCMALTMVASTIWWDEENYTGHFYTFCASRCCEKDVLTSSLHCPPWSNIQLLACRTKHQVIGAQESWALMLLGRRCFVGVSFVVEGGHDVFWFNKTWRKRWKRGMVLLNLTKPLVVEVRSSRRAATHCVWTTIREALHMWSGRVRFDPSTMWEKPGAGEVGIWCFPLANPTKTGSGRSHEMPWNLRAWCGKLVRMWTSHLFAACFCRLQDLPRQYWDGSPGWREHLGQLAQTLREGRHLHLHGQRVAGGEPLQKLATALHKGGSARRGLGMVGLDGWKNMKKSWCYRMLLWGYGAMLHGW